RLDPCLVRPAPYQPQVGTFTAQQPQRRDDHGLAGPGLSGDDGETVTELQLGGLDDAQRAQPQVVPHQLSSRPRRSSSRRRAEAPRQPSTGSSNLRTNRSANGAGTKLANRTGSCPRTTSTRAPNGRSAARLPSHHSTPVVVSPTTSIASLELGETTSGLA